MKKFTFYIFLFLLISYGVFLRFYELSTGSFWIDEGYSSIISYFMSQNHFIPKLGSGVYEFSQYFFHFFQSIIFQLFGISDFLARIPSIIFGILNIILFYFFAQILLKNTKYKNIGVIFMMFLFLFSTWQIIWSREARFYEMLSFLYLLSSFLLYKFIKFEKNIYLFGFLLSFLIGLVFHQFFLAFLFISGIFFIKYSIQQKKYFPIFGLIFTIVLYLIIQFIIKSYNVTNLEFLNIIPTLNSISDYHFFTYFSFYIQVFFEQLGIIFVFYILGILYFIFSKKYSEFLIFGGVFIINIVAISFGYFAHSRYMFHLFSIITLIGGYSFILFLDNLLLDKNKYKKILAIILIIFGGFGIFKTYNFTFLPQRFYYIDETSPKPNFKNAYLYLKNNMKMDEKIVSGFPHMCFWYNLKNTKKCEFALSINLIGNSIFDEKILQKKSENYTNTKYLDDLSKIDGKKYYFVLDDLTIKNAINKTLINTILDKCYIVYKDVGNYDSSSFIGIWKCY